MPVEILPEGYADWIEFDDEPNILFMGEDPFWKTKTGSTSPNVAILYRGGPGFLDRSIDGGRTWSSIIPASSPPWFEDEDYYMFHADTSFLSAQGLCPPGRPTPAPANGNVDYMAYSGSLANSGYHHVLVRHTIAAGAGSHRPTYTGWLLSTIDDWVTHDWLQLNFALNDPNDQIIVGSEFTLAQWTSQASQSDTTNWGAFTTLIRYTDSLYGVHLARKTTTNPDTVEHLWFEVDFNTTTKVFTTPNSTDPNTVHDITASGDVLNSWYTISIDVALPLAVYNGESFGGGLITDRLGAGQPIWAHIGVCRFTSSGGNMSYDDTYVSGRLDDPDSGAQLVFAKFKYINKAGKMVFLYSINQDGAGDWAYYWVEFNCSTQTFGAVDTTWPGGVSRDFEQVGPIDDSNIILVARVVSEGSTNVTYEVALLDLSTSSLVSTAQQITIDKVTASDDSFEIVPMVASNNSAEIDADIAAVRFIYDYLGGSSQRHEHFLVDYTLGASKTAVPRQPTIPNTFMSSTGETTFRRLRESAFVSGYEDGFVWDIADDRLVLRKVSDCADVLDVVAHSGAIDGGTDWERLHGASFGTGGKVVLMLDNVPSQRHFLSMRYAELDYDAGRVPYASGHWPEDFMLNKAGDVILVEEFMATSAQWATTRYDGDTGITPLNVVAGIPAYEWQNFGVDPYRTWENGSTDPSDIIARNNMAKMYRDPSLDDIIYVHGNLDFIDFPSDPYTVARFDVSNFIASYSISWSAILNGDDVTGWNLAYASALLLYSGTLYVIRDTGSACYLWEYNGTPDDWTLVGGPISLDSVNHDSMDVDNFSGDIVVAGRVADLIMVVSAPSPYTSWGNLTFSHRNDRGVTGLLVLD